MIWFHCLRSIYHSLIAASFTSSHVPWMNAGINWMKTQWFHFHSVSSFRQFTLPSFITFVSLMKKLPFTFSCINSFVITCLHGCFNFILISNKWYTVIILMNFNEREVNWIHSLFISFIVCSIGYVVSFTHSAPIHSLHSFICFLIRSNRGHSLSPLILTAKACSHFVATHSTLFIHLVHYFR